MMAVTQHTRRLLASALGGYGLADEVADMVDGGGGSLSLLAQNAIRAAAGNRAAGDDIIAAIENDTALGSYGRRHLANALGSQTAAGDISDELG